MTQVSDGNDAEGRVLHYEGRALQAVPPPPPPKPPLYKRPAFLVITAAVLIVAIIGGTRWYIHSRSHETTDDAFIAADVTSVSPQAAGRVQGVQIIDNQDVSKRTVMIQIDPTDFDIALHDAQMNQKVAEAQLQQADAELKVVQAQAEQAKADVVTAEATAWRADNDLGRYKAAGTEAVSREQLDQAMAASKTSAAELEAARQKDAAAKAQIDYARSLVQTDDAQVAKARVAVEQARQQLSYTTIAAPIDGTVTNKRVDVGDYVQVGQALLALVPHDVYVTANFKETQLANIKPGDAVEIHVDAFPGRTFRGKVDSIERGTGAVFSLLPPENATGNYVKVVQRIPVKILFDPLPGDVRLAPGMSVEPSVNVR